MEIREYLRWSRFVARKARQGFVHDGLQHLAIDLAVVVASAIVVLWQTDGDVKSALVTGLAVVLVLAALLGLWNLLALFLVDRDVEQELMAFKTESPDPAPQAFINQIPMVESQRFTRGAEWRLTVTNIGEVTSTFRAQMEPVQGRSHWYLPWLDNSQPEWKIAPQSQGTVLPFAHTRVGQKVEYKPVRSNPDTGKIEPEQYLSIRYTERLAEAGIEPSVGSRGDSYDNALAESVIGLFKTEVIRRRGPWQSHEDVEFATLEWVWWFNHHRLLEPIGYVPPVEYEEAFYRREEAQTALVALKVITWQQLVDVWIASQRRRGAFVTPPADRPGDRPALS